MYHLLISDPALREAIEEQISLANLPAGAPVVVLDEADTDMRHKADALAAEKGAVLALGAIDETDGITEHFSKPIRLGHLLARLRFHAEHTGGNAAPLHFGSYRLDARQRTLMQGNQAIRLTEKETALLDYLAQRNAPASREDLLADIWGYDARIDTHTLETHIYQLRRKAGADIILHDKAGYRVPPCV